MNPRHPNPRILELVEELRRVEVPEELADDILREVRCTELQTFKTKAPWRGLAFGATGAVTTVAVLLMVAAKPEMAFSQVLDLNRNHVNIVAITTSKEGHYEMYISGNRYSTIEKFSGPNLSAEMERDFDGKRQFRGAAFKSTSPSGDLFNVIGYGQGQKYGMIFTGNHYTPSVVGVLGQTQGHFDPGNSDPTLFPFANPQKVADETFNGLKCDVYRGTRKQQRSWEELVSGKVFVDKASHRIVGKKLEYTGGQEISTTYAYPALIPESTFKPRPDWRVYDLDIIHRKLMDKVEHPLIARTEGGEEVELVCAARQASGDLLVLWKGVPPNGSLDYAAKIIGNPTQTVYCMPNTTSTRVLLQKNMFHPWKGELLGGHSIKPKNPIGDFVDLKVPHFHVDHARPIKFHGKTVGYKSKLDGYARFFHVPVLDVPDSINILE